MEATVTHRFFGAVDGKIYPCWHEVGSIVRGDLAYCAIEQGDAVPVKKREAITPEHTKILSASPPAQASQEPIAKKRGRPKQK